MQAHQKTLEGSRNGTKNTNIGKNNSPNKHLSKEQEFLKELTRPPCFGKLDQREAFHPCICFHLKDCRETTIDNLQKDIGEYVSELLKRNPSQRIHGKKVSEWKKELDTRLERCRNRNRH